MHITTGDGGEGEGRVVRVRWCGGGAGSVGEGQVVWGKGKVVGGRAGGVGGGAGGGRKVRWWEEGQVVVAGTHHSQCDALTLRPSSLTSAGWQRDHTELHQQCSPT